MKKRTNPVWSQDGFAIPLVLVIMVAVFFSALAVIDLAAGVKKTAEGSIKSTEFTLLTAQLNSLLKFESSCRDALGGPNVYGGPLDLSTAQEFNMGAGNFSPIKIYEPGGTTVWLEDDPAGQNRFGRLTITRLELQNVAPISAPTLFKARLFIEAEKDGPTVGGSSVMSQDIWLTVRVRSSLGVRYIESCTSVFFDGGGPDPVELPQCDNQKEVLWSDGTTVTCIQIRCDGGTTWTGNYLASGDKECI